MLGVQKIRISKKWKKIFLSLFFLFYVVPVYGSGLSLEGQWFTDAYVPTRRPFQSAFHAVSTHLWGTLKPTMELPFQMKATLTVDQFLQEDRNKAASFANMGLREWILEGRKKWVEWSVGKQILSWSQMDVFTSWDVWSAFEEDFFTPDRERKRQGQWAVGVRVAPSERFEADLVWVPFLKASSLLIPSDLQIPTQLGAIPLVVSTSVNREAFRWKDSNLGAKVQVFGNQWDLGFLGFYGWSPTSVFWVPEGTLASGGVPSTLSILSVLQRQGVLGFKGSFSFEKSVFRFESAYVQKLGWKKQMPFLEPPFWHLSIGYERDLWKHVRFVSEGFLKGYFRHQDENTLQGANAFQTALFQKLFHTNALLLRFQEKLLGGVYLHLFYEEENLSDWRWDMRFLMYLPGNDFWLGPKLSYRVSDQFSWIVGADVFSGSSDRPMGVLKSFDSFYTEFKVLF